MRFINEHLSEKSQKIVKLSPQKELGLLSWKFIETELDV